MSNTTLLFEDNAMTRAFSSTCVLHYCYCCNSYFMGEGGGQGAGWMWMNAQEQAMGWKEGGGGCSLSLEHLSRYMIYDLYDFWIYVCTSCLYHNNHGDNRSKL